MQMSVGARQSEAVGAYHPENETTAGELFHALLLDWQLVLPATFHFDETGAGTWQSTTGRRKRLECAAMPRAFLPHVQSAGVDSRIYLDIKLKVDHLLTQVTVQLPPVQKRFTLQRSTSSVPSRKALKLPEVVDATRTECDATPPACKQWTIEWHDKLF